MKKILYFWAVMLAFIMLLGCGPNLTVCDCLKDDGSHKQECDELGESMSSDEINKALIQCK